MQLTAKDYAIKQVGDGAFAYALKAPRNPVEEAIFLCVPCFEQSIKSILQLDQPLPAHNRLKCPRCKASILTARKVGESFVAPVRRARDDYL